jgi:hypothetical protein
VERRQASRTNTNGGGWGVCLRYNCDGMGVTVELQNLGDAQLCRDITAHLEHAFSGRQGEWRVSIAGSRVAESWDLRVDGPNGFERSYTLSAAAGEHEPAAIRMLVLRLLPTAKA